jgi:hypothetical protein
VVEDGDIFGDGVNVAARLEGLAEPGRICVSARVQEDAAGRLDVAFEDMGEQALKNIARPIRAYRVVSAGDAAPTRVTPGPALPDEPSIAVLPFARTAPQFALDSPLEGGVRCELVSAVGLTPPIKGSFIAGLMNS